MQETTLAVPTASVVIATDVVGVEVGALTGVVAVALAVFDQLPWPLELMAAILK